MHRKLDKITTAKECSINSDDNQVGNFIARYDELSEQAIVWARETQSVLEDLPFSDRPAELLDLYVPHTEVTNSQTLYINLHFDYQRQLSKGQSAFAATNFQQNGNYFAVLSLPQEQCDDIDELLDSQRRAIVYLYQNAETFGYDRKKIVLIGCAAGGSLAAMLATTSWPKWRSDHQVESVLPKMLLKGVVLISGIYDLQLLDETAISIFEPINKKQLQANSPNQKRVKNTCPFVVAYGGQETTRLKQQAIEFGAHLEQQQIEYQLVEIQNRNQFDIVLDLARSDSQLFHLARSVL